MDLWVNTNICTKLGTQMFCTHTHISILCDYTQKLCLHTNIYYYIYYTQSIILGCHYLLLELICTHMLIYICTYIHIHLKTTFRYLR